MLQKEICRRREELTNEQVIETKTKEKREGYYRAKDGSKRVTSR